MAKRLLLGLLVVALAGLAIFSNLGSAPPALVPVTPPAPGHGGGRIVWETSYSDAVEKSKAQRKPIMIDFYADWCGACHLLDQETYPAPEVVAEARNFVCVKINFDEQKLLAQNLNVNPLPAILWLDSEGKELSRLEGAGMPPSEFAAAMRAAHDKFITASRAV